MKKDSSIVLGRPRHYWPGPIAISARCADAARALREVTVPSTHARRRGGTPADGAMAADWRQGFSSEPEGTSGVALGKFIGAGAHRGGRVTRGGQRQR
jgi:hypothetical protein